MTSLSLYAPGHYDYADSYGLIACQLVRHLSRLGVYVNALGMGDTVVDNQPPDIRAVTERPIRPSYGGIVLGYPNGYARHSWMLHNGPRIAVTMFESSKIPEEWIDPLNALDAVVVPSWWCAEVFRACGVTVPVHVVPLGVSEVYQYAHRRKDRPLTFLTFLDRGARKGGIIALKAFLMAFGEDMDYKLILKGREPKVGFALTNPNIEVILRDMDEQELYDLYLDADVLVNPHKGEGFGMIPREAACTGCLAMTTGWSGTADGLEAWGMPLPYTLVEADWQGNKYLQGRDLGVWAEVDPERVASKLQTIAANRDYYRAMAEVKAHRAMNLYSWAKFAEQVYSIWQEVAIGYRDRTAAIAA